MKAALKTVPREESVSRLVSDIMESSNFDKHVAVAKLRKICTRNAELRTRALDTGLWEMVSLYIRMDRRDTREAPPARPDNTDGLVRMSKRCLMDYRLSDGTRLADARRPELEKAANWHETMERASAREAKWLRLIISKLPDDRTKVVSVLNEDGLLELRQVAELGAESTTC